VQQLGRRSELRQGGQDPRQARCAFAFLSPGTVAFAFSSSPDMVALFVSSSYAGPWSLRAALISKFLPNLESQVMSAALFHDNTVMPAPCPVSLQAKRPTEIEAAYMERQNLLKIVQAMQQPVGVILSHSACQGVRAAVVFHSLVAGAVADPEQPLAMMCVADNAATFREMREAFKLTSPSVEVVALEPTAVPVALALPSRVLVVTHKKNGHERALKDLDVRALSVVGDEFSVGDVLPSLTLLSLESSPHVLFVGSKGQGGDKAHALVAASFSHIRAGASSLVFSSPTFVCSAGAVQEM